MVGCGNAVTSLPSTRPSNSDVEHVCAQELELSEPCWYLDLILGTLP
jgi:hypothetical protein